MWKIGICILLQLMFGQAANAQKKDSVLTGTVIGIIRDSVYNFNLAATTVAVYRNSLLLHYSLTDNTGAFSISHLPFNEPLTLVASFIGYNSLSMELTISSAHPLYNIKALNMERAGGKLLEDVIVRVLPPVRMNGDTLEFNADAFKMDKNAVVEDLMRRLPGITIWGDGAITINGKKIKQVLVEGKPFFGGDFSIAIQNLPKSAVDKIQVYRSVVDERSRIFWQNIGRWRYRQALCCGCDAKQLFATYTNKYGWGGQQYK
jgi:hypothetical protein